VVVSEIEGAVDSNGRAKTILLGLTGLSFRPIFRAVAAVPAAIAITAVVGVLVVSAILTVAAFLVIFVGVVVVVLLLLLLLVLVTFAICLFLILALLLISLHDPAVIIVVHIDEPFNRVISAKVVVNIVLDTIVDGVEVDRIIVDNFVLSVVDFPFRSTLDYNGYSQDWAKDINVVLSNIFILIFIGRDYARSALVDSFLVGKVHRSIMDYDVVVSIQRPVPEFHSEIS
jgi:membrane protein implicated in regulation of membrane protease activity